jgi:Uncharacterized conserved protein (DUF2203)
MKRRRNKEGKNLRALRLWTYDEASRAIPYLRSVVSSLREHWLEAQSKRREGELLAVRPGRPDRSRLIAEEAVHSGQENAESQFNEALEELMKIDVYLLDPARGVALIPFRKEDDLAWYVFDQFDGHGLSGWRYHNDPLEECRPLAPSSDGPPGAASMPNGSVT